MANKKDKKGRVLKEGEDQLNDGRYRYRYTDTNGKRHAIYSWRLTTTDRLPAGKRQCKSLREKEVDLQKDLADGINTYDAQITVNELVKRYLSTKVNLKLSTHDLYQRIFRNCIKDSALGKKQISNIKNSDILKFYADLKVINGLCNNSIGNVHTVLNPAFQMAVKDNLIRINPCSGCLQNYYTYSTKREALTIEQQNSILKFLKENTEYYTFYYTLFYFLLETGLRVGEVVGLTWNDIDFDKQVISVNHQLVYGSVNGKFKYYIETTKNNLTRIVPFSNDLAQTLKKYKEEISCITNKQSYNIDGYSNFVFCRKSGSMLTSRAVESVFRRITSSYNIYESKKAIEDNRNPILIKKLSPHVLRHTYCTRMAEKGIDIKVLQALMGHKTLKVTMQVYNHVNNDRIFKEFHRVMNDDIKET